MRTVSIDQGEHYKVDLSKIDPENAAVTRTTNGDDSVHIEGMSKTKNPGSGSSSTQNVGSDKIIIGGSAGGSKSGSGSGTPGPRTDENPAVPSSAGSGSTYVGSQLRGGQRPGYLRLGGF